VKSEYLTIFDLGHLVKRVREKFPFDRVLVEFVSKRKLCWFYEVNGLF
jgi:hypothetical protein